MTFVPPPPALAARQSLQVRMRADLQAQQTESPAGGRVTIKDPISLKYHTLRNDEWFVLQLLREGTNLESIRSAYQKKFAPDRVTLRQIQSLIFRFHRSELLLSNTLGQAMPLGKRSTQSRWQKRWGVLQSALFIRFPGIDPEPFLRWTVPVVRFALHPLFLVGYAVLVAAAVVLFVTQAGTYWQDMPSAEQLFQPRQLLGFAVVLGLTKIAHELGHAVVCKYYGRECHEIGPMLLVMTPALYCDTSDAWMLTNRWQRAAVGAAGMGVEVLLAAIATFVWWYSEPGFVHAAAMKVMLVCSVSTLLFNANPLLRYDGYYILSDLCDSPNLAQQSRRYLNQQVARWMLGVRNPAPLQVSRRAAVGMIVYQVAATLYRWGLTLVILWFVSQFLKPYGLQSIGWVLAVFSVAVMVYRPLKEWTRMLRVPGATRKFRRWNLLGTGVVGIALVGGLLIPLPRYIVGEVEIVPHHPVPVYVTAAGRRLSDAMPGFWAGGPIEKGETVLQLEDQALELQWLKAMRRVESQRLLLERLQQTQASDEEAASQIPFTQSAYDDLLERADKLAAKRKALTITSPASGRFVPAKWLPKQGDSQRLERWYGQVTADANVGAYLETGTPLGVIAKPDRYDALLTVQPADLEFVQIGQPVVVQLNGFASQALAGQVVEIAQQDNLSDTVQGSKGTGSDGTQQLAYPVRIQLDATALPLTYYESGQGRVLVESQSIAQRIYRSLASLFRF
ncbi:Peptidase family M50 [Roseimaritima multifibrata]|uniref:Peptidase family M50 n=1 Tax=Roseimaritima multifibrata TaxID=1930274 RepID=A0A517MNE4_9BACT|nr:Peptidase family M50 [Roseimaritima multifibrata]